MTLSVTLRNTAMILLFALLNAGDLVSTWIDLHAGMREGNPFMSMLLTQHGFGALIVYKVIVVTIVGAVMTTLWDTRPRLVSLTLLTCNAMVLGAVAINVAQMMFA